MAAPPASLETPQRLRRALAALLKLDPSLGVIEETAGRLPFSRRPPGFAALARTIVGQQLSTSAARAIFGRLEADGRQITPALFLESSDDALRACGLSFAKIRYCRGLAEATLDGRLDFDGLAALSDEACLEVLVALKGIGRWTAEIYLLAALCRPDVWPVGDVGLQAAVQKLRQLDERPVGDTMHAVAVNWRPYRSVAARLLWHYYDTTKAPV